MPFLGDWRPKKPEDVKRMEAAKTANEQLAIMATIKDFEIWNGEKWVDGQKGMSATFVVEE